MAFCTSPQKPHFSQCGVLDFSGVEFIFFTVACRGVPVLWICAGNKINDTEMFSVIAEQGLCRAKVFSASHRDPPMSGSGGFGYWLGLNHSTEVEYITVMYYYLCFY